MASLVGSWASGISSAWKNIDPIPAEPIDGEVVPGYPPATVLPGLLFPPPFEIPSPPIPSGRPPFPLTPPTTTDAGLDTIGVPLGEDVLIREDDRGVTFVLIKAFTGVARSSRPVPFLVVLGVLLRVVGARY